MDQLVDLMQITAAVNQDCRLRQIRWWTIITPIELNQFPAAASGAISTGLIGVYNAVGSRGNRPRNGCSMGYVKT